MRGKPATRWGYSMCKKPPFAGCWPKSMGFSFNCKPITQHQTTYLLTWQLDNYIDQMIICARAREIMPTRAQRFPNLELSVLRNTGGSSTSCPSHVLVSSEIRNSRQINDSFNQCSAMFAGQLVHCMRSKTQISATSCLLRIFCKYPSCVDDCIQKQHGLQQIMWNWPVNRWHILIKTNNFNFFPQKFVI